MVASVRNAVFKERALVEGARYAKDKMVFLRELCQNARDAGALTVTIQTEEERGFFVLTFSDNGVGMTFSEAEQFLFTLYASSKEGDPKNAGKFGVGFWSVLLSSPVIAAVESRTREGAPWKVVFNRELDVQQVPSTDLSTPGTKVTLRYEPEQFQNLEVFSQAVETALFKYCRHLRNNTVKGGPLPILLNGGRIDRPFSVDGPHYMTFDNGDVQGAVGLAPTPSVSVFARGLLVWQGTALDELRYGSQRQNRSLRISGLAPCYVLNGDRLNATLDRRALLDDAALQKLRKTALERMDEFVEQYLDRVSPFGFAEKIKRRTIRRFKNSGLLARISMAFAALAIILLGFFSFYDGGIPQRPPAVAAEDKLPSALVPIGNHWTYIGPTVGGAAADNVQLSLAYRPPISLYFRIAAMEQLDEEQGILEGGDNTARGSYPGAVCKEKCVHIAATVDASQGALVLPLPTGYEVVPASVQKVPPETAPSSVFATAAGEPLLLLNENFKGQVTFTAARVTSPFSSLPKERLRTLLHVPHEMSTFPTIATHAKRCDVKTAVSEKVACAVDVVTRIVSYDDSHETVEAYRAFYDRAPRSGWLDFVFTEGKGDCDVLNTVLCVLLRCMGIPARLAVGPLGENGIASVGMHAWVEYWDDDLHTADATFGVAPAPSSAAAPSTTSSPNFLSNEVPARREAPLPSQKVAPPLDAKHNPAFGDVYLAWGIAALSLVVLIALFGRRSSSDRMHLHLTGKPAARRVDAAKMAAAAMAEPHIWGNTDMLFSRKILPLINAEKSISLKDAKRLAASGRLYTATEASYLTRAAKTFNTPVLNATDPAFQELSAQLTGAIDLDEIVAMDPLPPQALLATHAAEARLLECVSEIIGASGLSRELGIRLSQDKKLHKVRDVSLPGILVRPAHIVVIPVNAEILRTALSMAHLNWGAAVLLKEVSESSDLIFSLREALLFEAAQRLFEVRA